MTEEAGGALTLKTTIIRFAILLATSCGLGFAGVACGALDAGQAVTCAVFLGIIMGTLFFWNFRLAVAFLGLAVLMFSRSLDVPHFVK